MKTAYDTTARRRAVTLMLNEELVAQARRLTGNLAAEVEALLVGFVMEQSRRRDAEVASLKRAAVSWNAFNDDHGSFADEFSTL